jgi:LysR family nod box-dependent transcriptional activator
MRLQRLDLNLLIMLDILMAEGSVSQTAQRLAMTQPAISNALARLRAHFDDELFVLMDRRMVPTPLCRSLAEPVRGIIAELSVIAAARSAFDPATADRTISIICSDYVFLVHLSDAIRALAPVAPGVRVRTMQTAENMGELLRSGRADFLIIPEQRKVPGLPSAPLFTDDFSVICWSENRGISDAISIEQYLAHKHVGASIGPQIPPHIEQSSLDKHGVFRDFAVYAPNFTSVAEVVVGTNYIATMQSRAARILAQRLPLRLLRPPVEIAPFTVCVQWTPAMASEPGVAWMRSFFADHAKGLADAPA